ncbi:hypothetical protein ACFWMV_28040, partial [Streptomyces mutabilis]
AAASAACRAVAGPDQRHPRPTQLNRRIRHGRAVVAAENLTQITSTRGDGYLVSDDPAGWVEC